MASEAVCASGLTPQAVLDLLRATVAALSADIAGWDQPAASFSEMIFHGQLLSCVGELLEAAQESVPHLAKLQAKFQTKETLTFVDEEFLRNVSIKIDVLDEVRRRFLSWLAAYSEVRHST
jgi:hypothetical protein